MATDDHMVVTAVGAPQGASSMIMGDFELESGKIIKDAVICYTTYGTLNEVRPTRRHVRRANRGFYSLSVLISKKPIHAFFLPLPPTPGPTHSRKKGEKKKKDKTKAIRV